MLKIYTLYLPSDKNFFLIIKKQSFIGYGSMVEGGGGLGSVEEGYILDRDEKWDFFYFLEILLNLTKWYQVLTKCHRVLTKYS